MDLRSTVAAGCCAFGLTAGVVTAPPASADDPPPPPPPTPTEVPHLSSPQNLPPDTTDEPTGPPEGRGLTYLRELWHAVQTQDVSARDALLLLTQRPLDPNAAPPPGLAPGPQPPPPGLGPAPQPPPPVPPQ